MITDEELNAIEAERARIVAERLTAHNAGSPMMRFLSGPTVLLLAEVRELRGLARELAEALKPFACWQYGILNYPWAPDTEAARPIGHRSALLVQDFTNAEAALAKARQAGLL